MDSGMWDSGKRGCGTQGCEDVRNKHLNFEDFPGK